MSDAIIRETAGDVIPDTDEAVSEELHVAEKTTDADEKVLQVALDVFRGVALQPEIKESLNKQLQEISMGEERFVWVLQTGNEFQILCRPGTKEVAQTPKQCGYQPVDHPWISIALKGMAYSARFLLNLRITEDGDLMLPNGRRFSCVKTSWKDMNGATVRLFEACQLEGGEWFRVKARKSHAVHPFEDKTALREALDTEIDNIEKAGYVRESLSRDPDQPAEKNPFATSEQTFNIKA